MRSFAALKKTYRILKVLLSIGGAGKGSEPFAAVACDPNARTRFAQSARDMCLEYGLDGIDIDWEHPSDAQQGADYVQLLAKLRQFLPSPRFTLSTALPAGEWALQHIPLAQAAQYLDLVNIMSYDFSGPWVQEVGHQAQLFTHHTPHNHAATISCASCVRYFRSHGVPAKKILLGIPAYGRSFMNTRGVGHSFAGSGGEDGVFEYRDLPRPGTTEKVDKDVGAAYCVGGDGGFVSYDNPETVKMKATFARNHDLAGLFYWTGTGDHPDVSRSLVYSGYTALHN